jgi:hypothetical protein
MSSLEIFIASAEHFFSMTFYLLTNSVFLLVAGCRPYHGPFSSLHCVQRIVTIRATEQLSP